MHQHRLPSSHLVTTDQYIAVDGTVTVQIIGSGILKRRSQSQVTSMHEHGHMTAPVHSAKIAKKANRGYRPRARVVRLYESKTCQVQGFLSSL
jgi:hypothetical protein